MKVALLMGGIVLALATAFIGVLLFAGDVVTTRYATLSEARAQGPVARGWLPDILPASASHIVTSNNLDLNTSEGEFRFASTDYPAFVSQLRPYSYPSQSHSSLDGYVRKMHRRGYQSGVFSQDRSTWLFFCEESRGYCEYTMWLERE